MKIFISGGGGMVGKNFSSTLSRLPGVKVIAPSSKELDLRETGLVEEFLKKEKPDVIVHLAGIVGGIVDNMKHPYRYLIENSLIGVNLIDGALRAGVVNFLNISSSCIYPPLASQPFKPSELLTDQFEKTNEGYAIAKVVALRACEYIMQENKEVNYKTIIPCNLYGPHDKFKSDTAHMIPGVINRMSEAKLTGKETVDLWGNPTVRREFMYVQDLCDFLVLAINNMDLLEQNTNVGLGHDHTILEYYEAIADIVGFKGDVLVDATKPIGMLSKLVDSSSANALGWRAETTLQQGVRLTYNYFKKNIQE